MRKDSLNKKEKMFKFLLHIFLWMKEKILFLYLFLYFFKPNND